MFLLRSVFIIFFFQAEDGIRDSSVTGSDVCSSDLERFVPPAVGIGNPAAIERGDVEAGLASASKRIEATYQTPAQYHNAMEPHAIVAVWDGDTLSIDTPSQGLAMAQGRIAGLFGISPEKIHIRSPFLGGGFGS